MSMYATVIGTITGICLGYAVLYLFIGWQRQQGKRLNLLFALFAFGYAGTLLMGIWYRSQTTVEAYLAISRWDSIFIWLAFVGLNWYVAEYTAVSARRYLWGITAVLTVATLAAMFTPTVTFATMPTLDVIPLLWNETVNTLIGEENIWGIVLLLVQLTTLGFIVVASVRQWLRGEKQAAAVLLGGMAWFILALLYEILAQVGLWVYIPFAETGFLGIAVALSLQMAHSVINTEEALAASRKNLEEVVTARTAELQLAQQQIIAQAQETAVSEERSRIARDLHDSVTQTIYSASLIAEVMPQVWARSPEEGERNLFKLRQLVRGALAEMRTLLFELRPSALEKADLETLLPQLADAFTGRTRIPVDVRVTGSNHLPAEAKIAIYRITQEALNNIAKHAHATEVTLDLDRKPARVILSIADNGRGFDPHQIAPDCMGIAIMQERATAIQATFAIDSTAETGTHIGVFWPVAANQPNGAEE